MANLTETAGKGKAPPDTGWLDSLAGRLAPDGALSRLGLAAILLLHVAVWTAAAAIAQSAGAMHHDMTETYAWGREFQLGYAKHPPLFAWVAGTWFLVFPRTELAYYALSAVNAAVGLAGIWCLAGRLVPQGEHTGRAQTAALILTMLTPFFSVIAINFNANAILLASWPWTLWAFVRSLQTAKARDGVLFGLIAGLALLSKYNSILLLVSCLAAALLHPRRAAYFASLAPYAAIAACTLVCLPHAAWALDHKLSTVSYVLDKPRLAPAQLLRMALVSLLGVAAMFVVPLLAGAAASGFRQASAPLARALSLGVSPGYRWLMVLVLGPLLLTMVAAFASGLKLSTNYLLPALLIWPAGTTALGFPATETLRPRVLFAALAGWLGLALLAAPLVAIGAFVIQTPLAAEPVREVAIAATRAWRDAHKSTLAFVAGSETYAFGAPFYSPDNPRLYLMATPSASPWVTAGDLAKGGLLIICAESDDGCRQTAGRWLADPSLQLTLHIERSFLGLKAPGRDFRLFLIAPKPQP